MFDNPQRIIIGLERHILETIGFDFRVRYPQKALVKVVRQLFSPEEVRKFLPLAYEISLDMFKTFAPIKACTFTMVMATIELTALLTGFGVSRVRAVDLEQYHTNRTCVIEVMLDLLDLFTQFTKLTKTGPKFDLAKFIDIKIKLNQEVDKSQNLGRYGLWCDGCEDDAKTKYPITPGSATSPATTGSWPGGNSTKRVKLTQEPATMRFVYDAEEARKEKETIRDYFREDYEEYEIEVEEKIPEPEPRGHHGGRDRGRHNHRNNHDAGWAPYPRGGRHDRHKGGRKGGGYY